MKQAILPRVHALALRTTVAAVCGGCILNYSMFDLGTLDLNVKLLFAGSGQLSSLPGGVNLLFR